jgi:hypothetical protein
MSRLRCPYCFEVVGAAGIAYRCISPNPASCRPEADRALGTYQRLSEAPVLPRVFGPTKEASPRCSCGGIAKPVCPACHNDLPAEFGDIPATTIALVGAKEVGKSNYIAVLIQQLTNAVGKSFNSSLNALDDRTRRRYAQDFHRHIYEHRQVVPMTPSARDQIDVRYPLIYRFSLKRRFLGITERLRVNALTFFDTAGEDLTNSDTMSTENRYLANADGIVFLLDPLQLRSVRERLEGRVPLPSVEEDPMNVIGRVAGLVRSSARWRGSSGPMNVPVALAFSKIDAVRSLVDPGSPIHRGAQHDGFFDLSDAAAMDASMRAYVDDWVGSAFHRFIRDNFRTCSYFGVSALGSAPDRDGRLATGAAPFRVEDPFLWLLHQLGVVPGKKRNGPRA